MGKKVLIVEDSPDFRSVLKFLLEEEGHTVLEAEDGKKAVEIVKNQMPDLILMDIAMPAMDGLEAAKTIRKLDGASYLPIIAITAYWSFYYSKAKDAGFDDLINKPVEPTTLIPYINRYLEI